VHEVVHRGSTNGDIEELVAEEPRAVRYFLGMSYHSDPDIRKKAVKGIALAARHHPELVQKLVRQLVWAMNDESATNALTAPEVLQAIAEERPELLLPMVPDLTRLAADPGLHQGLAEALKTVVRRCPGKVGESLSRSLNDCRESSNGESL
jgi:hypothetical protein